MLLLSSTPLPRHPLSCREGSGERQQHDGQSPSWESNPILCGYGAWQHGQKTPKPESAALTCSWRLRALCFTADAWRAWPTRTCPSCCLQWLHHTLSKNKPKIELVKKKKKKPLRKKKVNKSWTSNPQVKSPLPQVPTRLTSVGATAEKKTRSPRTAN